MGDYENSASMYKKLYEEESEEHGLLVNAIASYVSGDLPHKAIELVEGEEDLLNDHYELSFNTSCALIDENKLEKAEARLLEAKRLCAAEIMKAEEMSEEDSEVLEEHEDLANIQVQRACLLQRRGFNSEANDLYAQVLKQGNKNQQVDVTVLAVACNNVVTLRSDGKSLFDSLKRINMASKDSLEEKLTRKQLLEIASNKCLLLAQAHKLDEARKELDKLQKAYPDHPKVAIVQAAIGYSEKKGKCEEFLTSYLENHPGSEEVLLALSQLYETQQNFEKAAEALSQLPKNMRARPRSLQAIVALHLRQKNPEKAVACLREAIDYWTKDSPDDEESLSSILQIAMRLDLKDSNFASEVFQLYLEKIDGSDTEALCGLIQALASTDPEKAETYAQRLKLPSYDHLDAEELEKAAIPKIDKNLKKNKELQANEKDKDADQKEDDDAAEKTTKAKKRRKRKIKYPKNFDPENPGAPPDPERWLPKRERAEFKKRMKKRDKALMRGPQGSMPVDDQAFRKQGPSTAQIEVTSDDKGRGSRPRNQPKRPGKKK
jgi:signal recognition particle subunit SRP72